MLRVIGCGVLAFAAGGCAASPMGLAQDVVVRSEPAEAHCVLTREGRTIATVKTPATVTLDRGSERVEVSCTKPGFGEGRAVIGPRTAATPIPQTSVTFPVAMATSFDRGSGASRRHAQGITVWLPPLAPGNAVPAAGQSGGPG